MKTLPTKTTKTGHSFLVAWACQRLVRNSTFDWLAVYSYLAIIIWPIAKYFIAQLGKPILSQLHKLKVIYSRCTCQIANTTSYKIWMTSKAIIG